MEIKNTETARTREYRWNIADIPEELKKDGEWLLSKACEPRITVKKKERVRVEKLVEKKGVLPFGKGKTEKLKAWETREREEKIPVDPEILETGWAEKGRILAVLEENEEKKEKAKKEEMPGRTVDGELIQPSEEEDGEMYPGRGVKRVGNELRAELSGFVRRGRNWVEILPFEHHDWSLGVSKDQASCFLSFSPGKKDAPPPKAEKIIDEAKRRGFSEEELFPAAALQKLLTASIHQQKPLKNYPITRERDAWFKIETSEDKLKGTLSIGKGSGKGKPLVLKEVGEAIRKSRFKGMDLEKIKQDLLDFYKGPMRVLEAYVLAEGRAPGLGTKQKLEFSCSFVKEEGLGELKKAFAAPVAGAGAEDGRSGHIESLEKFPLEKVSRMAFVRVGDEVASIVGTDKGDNGIDVFGSVLPGLPGEAPPLELGENLLTKGNKIVANENGILDLIELEGKIFMRVRPYREAVIEVELSADKMEGYISLEESMGFAEPLSIEQVNRVLEQQKLLKGIDQEALSEALLRAKNGEVVERVRIAEGRAPVQRGKSGRIRFHLRLAEGNKVRIGKNGKADFRTHDEITTVEKGQLIAELSPPVFADEEGWDVTGKVITPERVQGIELNIGENIRREEGSDGSVKLYAEKDGELEYDGKSIRIHELHQVAGDVDMKSGNIKFPGTVEIRGNVRRGFYVMAGLDINVAGTVEGALLSAGASIHIGQGVVGGNKAVLRAKEHIRAQFAEESILMSVGDTEIKNSCLRCEIKCNGTVRITGERGAIVGGKVFTKHGIVAKNLGNAKGVPTTISFGQDYLIADKIEQHEKEIGRLKDEISRLDSLMQEYEQKRRKEGLEDLRSEKLRNLKMIEKRSMRLFTLRERFEEHFDSSIIVQDTLYPGVVIESHGRFFEVKEARKGLVITFNQENGKIEASPANEASAENARAETGARAVKKEE